MLNSVRVRASTYFQERSVRRANKWNEYMELNHPNKMLQGDKWINKPPEMRVKQIKKPKVKLVDIEAGPMTENDKIMVNDLAAMIHTLKTND